jgi:hypothetical protein
LALGETFGLDHHLLTNFLVLGDLSLRLFDVVGVLLPRFCELINL